MSKKTPKEPYVVQYETKQQEEEYSQFWNGREYEDRAERIVLPGLIRHYPKQAKWMVDIGGSFGRLIEVYAKRFSSMAIVDYATNQFHLSLAPAKEHKMKVMLIAANAYHLPFLDDSQGALMSIRMMHHLEDPEKFFNEVNRVLSPGGVAIIEVANKNHLKRFLRCLIRLNFSEWKSDFSDIGKSGLQKNEKFLLIRNFRPGYIEGLMTKSGLVVKKRRSISWFRKTPVAGLPVGLVDFMERALQSISGTFMLGPSNWYVLQKSGELNKLTGTLPKSICDPKSRKQLTVKQLKELGGKKTGAEYSDLRFPKPRL